MPPPEGAGRVLPRLRAHAPLPRPDASAQRRPAFHVEHVSNPERLAERLADPASWLPASAWKDRQIRAYVASSYAISYFAQPQKLERSRVLSLLPAAAEDLLRAKDAVSEPWLPPAITSRT